jgi:hypothetical protein
MSDRNSERTLVYAAARGDSFLNALDDIAGLYTQRPPAVDDPWADQPTVMAGAAYNSEALDARALFGDVLRVPPPTLPPPPLVPSFPPPSGARVLAAERAASSVTTARTNRPWLESQNAPLAAVIVCGLLAAGFAVAAACAF